MTSDLIQAAALVCTLLGLLSAAAVLVRSRDGRLCLKVLLDFLASAGLLRLADDPTWRTILTAVTVIAIRKLVSFGLAQA